MKTQLEERHRGRFAALTPAEVALVRRAVLARWPDEPWPKSWDVGCPKALFETCRIVGLDHARVVLALAGDGRAEVRAVIEKLVGRPIRPWGATVEAEAVARGEGPAYGRTPRTGGSGTGWATATAPAPAAPRTRPRAVARDPRVVVAVAPTCPYKPGTARAAGYARWRPGARVDELLAEGLPRRLVVRDSRRGHVVLEWR